MHDRHRLHTDPQASVVVVGVSVTRAPHDRRVDLVADALRQQGRRVREVQVGVPAQGPQAWVAPVVERLRESVARRGPADSVHAFGWEAAVGLAALGEELPGPFVAHLADGPVPGTAPGELSVRERLAWAAARSADVVVLDSQWAVDNAVRVGVPRHRIVRGLPVTSLPDADPDPQSTHPGTGGDGRLRLLAVGGIGRSAGTDLLLRALRRVPDVDLVVAAPAGASWRQLTGATQWLERLGGADASRHIQVAPFSPRLLADCDAVVDAGTTAGSCDGVVTAMAHRRAVLASDLGPRAEAVVDGTTGAVVRPGDWRAWCSQIAALMRDPFKLEAYGDAGLERSRAGFAPSRRAELITRLDAELGADARVEAS